MSTGHQQEARWHGRQWKDVMSVYRFFKDDDFNFVTLSVIGTAAAGTADVGEVLETVGRIKSGDASSWVDGWAGTAERLLTEAEGNAAAGRRRSAAAQQLRASQYLAAATYHADGTGVPDQFAALWERHRNAWDAAVDLGAFEPCVVERVTVPYEDTTLPGYFFRAGPSDEPRRTLIYTNGSDGSVTNCWSEAIRAATARGWNAFTYDGPGQNAALVRQGIPFRPDWEHVLRPVVDTLLARPDVAADELAVLGVSQAGYWVPRALTGEDRIAAAVADPGVMDVSTTMHEHLAKSLTKLLDEGARAKFDQEVGLYEKFSRSARAMFALRMRPYGTTSPFEFFTAARRYKLDPDELSKVTCPVLVTDPEGEQFWPGQSEQLAGHLPHATLMRFTAAEGADLHCEPAGQLLRSERILDWLDEQIPG